MRNLMMERGYAARNEGEQRGRAERQLVSDTYRPASASRQIVIGVLSFLVLCRILLAPDRRPLARTAHLFQGFPRWSTGRHGFLCAGTAQCRSSESHVCWLPANCPGPAI